jgi:hypothetical protein
MARIPEPFRYTPATPKKRGILTRIRDAVTGRFTTAADAAARPRETVRETGFPKTNVRVPSPDIPPSRQPVPGVYSPEQPVGPGKGAGWRYDVYDERLTLFHGEHEVEILLQPNQNEDVVAFFAKVYSPR